MYNFLQNSAVFSSKLPFVRRMQVDKQKCIGCGKCAQLCPAKALTMRRKLPHIDRSRCITCFCCQEFCPKGALEAKRTALARLLTGTE